MYPLSVDLAVDITFEALFANHGQSCCAGSRTYVHEKIYDQFVAKTVAKAKARKVGDPFDSTVAQGPQIDEEMMTKVLCYIESGKSDGAKLQCGGKRIGDVGFFIEPTVFSDVTDNMKIAQEEVSMRILTFYDFWKQLLWELYYTSKILGCIPNIWIQYYLITWSLLEEKNVMYFPLKYPKHD